MGMGCFHNIINGCDYYCKNMKSVEVDPKDEHKIVERSPESWSCAWCTLHNKPCKDLNYYCSSCELVTGHWDDDMNWIEERL